MVFFNVVFIMIIESNKHFFTSGETQNECFFMSLQINSSFSTFSASTITINAFWNALLSSVICFSWCRDNSWPLSRVTSPCLPNKCYLNAREIFAFHSYIMAAKSLVDKMTNLFLKNKEIQNLYGLIRLSQEQVGILRLSTLAVVMVWILFRRVILFLRKNL